MNNLELIKNILKLDYHVSDYDVEINRSPTFYVTKNGRGSALIRVHDSKIDVMADIGHYRTFDLTDPNSLMKIKIEIERLL